MTDYSPPSFISIPMAMVCSKTGCGSSRIPMVDPQIGLGGTMRAGKYNPLISVPQDLNTRADSDFLYIFEPAVQLVFEMNSTAGFIIGSCAGQPKRFDEVLSEIRNSFAKPSNDIEQEVFGFLTSLQASGFRISMV